MIHHSQQPIKSCSIVLDPDRVLEKEIGLLFSSLPEFTVKHGLSVEISFLLLVVFPGFFVQPFH